MNRLHKKHRFALSILAGIGCAGLLSHGVASVVESMHSAPLAETTVAVQAIDVRPKVDIHVARYDRSDETSASNAYAQSLGYRDWNHYLEHRPKNKMGKRDDHPALPLDRRETKRAEFVTRSIHSAPIAGESETALAVIDPIVVQPAVDDPAVLPDTRYIVDNVGGGYCCDRTYLDKPVVSVPEPSPLWLLGAGVVALILRKRKFA